jgi:multidrug resistance efflux pump
MSEVTVQQLETQRESMKQAVEMRQAVQRLTHNVDFRKVITEQFMEKECARYVQASGDPALSERNQKDALAIAQAAGHLKRYLSVLIQMGNAAENELESIDNALDDARAETAITDVLE